MKNKVLNLKKKVLNPKKKVLNPKKKKLNLKVVNFDFELEKNNTFEYFFFFSYHFNIYFDLGVLFFSVVFYLFISDSDLIFTDSFFFSVSDLFFSVSDLIFTSSTSKVSGALLALFFHGLVAMGTWLVAMSAYYKRLYYYHYYY